MVMKDIVSFLKWQFSKIIWVDYAFILSISLTVIGILFSYPFLTLVGLFLMVVMFFTLLVKTQWVRWKAEKKQFLNKIKED